MKLYQDFCLPCLINLVCGVKAVSRLRAEVVPLAEGRVLEVGAGGGLNFPFYDPHKVESICAIEPSEFMRGKAEEAVQGMDIPVELLGNVAEEIPLNDGSVDSVVLTFTLCTIPDWRTALWQIHRVLKPGGRVFFCEHGLAPDPSCRSWQNRINPLWRSIAGGCNLNRPIPDLLEAGGFRIETLKEEYAAGMPKLAGYVYRGTAGKSS